MICPYCGNLISYNSYFDAFYCPKCGGFFKQATVVECNDLNKPLTLDELRKMDGEPVWIKLFDPDEGFWVLRNEWVDTRNPEPMILFHMRWYSYVDYGKTWLAYRQKPEEGVGMSKPMSEQMQKLADRYVGKN